MYGRAPRAELQAIPGQKIPIYPDLPGHKIGPNDSLQITDLAEGETPTMKNLTWWHHADRPEDREVPTGALCGISMEKHRVQEGSLEKLEKGVKIWPSAWCMQCHRHIWIRYINGSQDLGSAHWDYRDKKVKPGEVAVKERPNHYGRQCKGRDRLRSPDCNGRKSYQAQSCRACFNQYRRHHM